MHNASLTHHLCSTGHLRIAYASRLVHYASPTHHLRIAYASRHVHYTSLKPGPLCRSPVNSYVMPIGGATPGYESEVVFADGTFVEGATSELSADGPLREPYAAFCQVRIRQTDCCGNYCHHLDAFSRHTL